MFGLNQKIDRLINKSVEANGFGMTMFCGMALGAVFGLGCASLAIWLGNLLYDWVYGGAL